MPFQQTKRFLPAIAFNEELADEPRVLPGLYPWLRFGEYFTRDEWVAHFGINIDRIEYKAASIYLEGERLYFGGFMAEYSSFVGPEQAIALTQAKLEGTRRCFNHTAMYLCASPIEQLMLASLMWVQFGYERKPVVIWNSAEDPVRPQAEVIIAPQYETEGHRMDFAVFINIVANEEVRISVECDGHEFHERTKEQAARDKGQYNDVQIAGWRPLRFTGSMLWRDPQGCAAQVAELAARQIEVQFRRRGWM